MKKVVYTVLIGDYKLKEPTFVNKDWSLICFSDRVHKSNNWTVKKIKHFKDSRKKSREIKIRCDRFLDFDLCLYIDAKFTVRVDLNKFVEENMKTDIVVMEHNKRSCIYKELDFCIKMEKDDINILNKQSLSYRKSGFPKNFKVYAPGIMLRRNTNQVIDFMKLWYKEVEKYSYRDIPSFSYVLWKNPIEVSTIPFKKTYKKFR
jgi:hypothetical protein